MNNILNYIRRISNQVKNRSKSLPRGGHKGSYNYPGFWFGGDAGASPARHTFSAWWHLTYLADQASSIARWIMVPQFWWTCGGMTSGPDDYQQRSLRAYSVCQNWKMWKGANLSFPCTPPLVFPNVSLVYNFNLGTSQAASTGGTRCRLSSEGDHVPSAAKKWCDLFSNRSNEVNLDDLLVGS